MSNLKTYRFIFSAAIGEMNIKANISCPLFVTWKRSQESATSQTIDLTAGKADFKNEVLKLQVNMYFDVDANCFQEKKSSFSFTMKTPKGDKAAGVVYIDLSKMLNNKMEELDENFPLEKCPVKDSTVKIKLTSECVGEKTDDSQSVSSISMMGGNPSTLSINSTAPEAYPEKIENTNKRINNDQSANNDKEIAELKQKLSETKKENESLKKELLRAKESMKGDNLKEELLKSKALQDKLEEEVNSLKKLNQDHEKELENVREKLEDAYTNLYSNLSKHFL